MWETFLTVMFGDLAKTQARTVSFLLVALRKLARAFLYFLELSVKAVRLFMVMDCASCSTDLSVL